MLHCFSVPVRMAAIQTSKQKRMYSQKRFSSGLDVSDFSSCKVYPQDILLLKFVLFCFCDGENALEKVVLIYRVAQK